MNSFETRRVIACAFALVAASCRTSPPPVETFPERTRETPLSESPSTEDASSRPADVAAPSTAPPPSAGADPAPRTRPRLPDGERVSFEFRDTPYVDALKLIADRAQVNFVYPQDLEGALSATLRDVTLDQAFETVVREGRLEVYESSGVLGVRPIVAPTSVSRIYRPRSTSASTLEPQVKALLGDASAVTVDIDANLLLVSGTEDQLGRVDEWMSAIDLAQRQEVLIEARILEVSLNDDFAFGVGLALDDISAGDTTTQFLSNFLRADDSFQVTTLDPTSDFSGIVRALQSYGRLHVIATPRVLAMNQTEAKIEITEKIPYIDATATTSGSATGITTSSVEEVEFEIVGIRLHVTPSIGTDGSITLKIHQEVSEVVDFFQSVPVTDSRLIDTRFVTNDRETIVIGGLMKERTRQTDDGIPWLMDIPLLGWLFSGTDTQKEKIELLVFITPRIVEAGSIGSVSSEFKREFIRKNYEYGQESYQEFLDDVP